MEYSQCGDCISRFDKFLEKEKKEQEEREQFAKKILQVIATKAFNKFYEGKFSVYLRYEEITDEMMLKEIQKLF